MSKIKEKILNAIDKNESLLLSNHELKELKEELNISSPTVSYTLNKVIRMCSENGLDGPLTGKED
ncbi:MULTISPECIES: MarR family transcriptional regulator [Acinetobacter]|uniref:MarR family transcriptional regulator n=1 Tax=Acinetobacter TaxID=469 RepID=UPI00054DCEC5|nr:MULTISPECIES: MarR family transcriptional regulator [Acinetobacter]MCU4599105.1 MarR family transcriptional regulator [Acinetobacter bereziniae]